MVYYMGESYKLPPQPAPFLQWKMAQWLKKTSANNTNYSSGKEGTDDLLSSNSPYSIQSLQQQSYLCQKEGEEMQGQFSEKDSGTPYFLEGEDGQENKLHYEKVEWKNWISPLTGLNQK